MAEPVYFDADGCYGTAEEGYFVVVDTTLWTPADWELIDSCYDTERMGIAMRLAKEYGVTR